jgi:hypothetical protein
MMDKLNTLFEKYKFDYIYINPKELEYLDWDFIPEESLIDFKSPPGYLGTITLKNKHIEVYYNEKITSGDVIFKYKDIRKERKIKLNNLTE